MYHSMVVEISCRYGGWGSQTGGCGRGPKLGLGGGLLHVVCLFILGCTGSWVGGFLLFGGTVVVGHRLHCLEACGIFLDQRSNLCLLRWQADSLLLSLQGSPGCYNLTKKCQELFPVDLKT